MSPREGLPHPPGPGYPGPAPTHHLERLRDVFWDVFWAAITLLVHVFRLHVAIIISLMHLYVTVVQYSPILVGFFMLYSGVVCSVIYRHRILDVLIAVGCAPMDFVIGD